MLFLSSQHWMNDPVRCSVVTSGYSQPDRYGIPRPDDFHRQRYITRYITTGWERATWLRQINKASKTKPTHAAIPQEKKKPLLILFNECQQHFFINFFDKIYTLSNLLLGPKIKIPSTSSYTKLVYCLNIVHSHFHRIQNCFYLFLYFILCTYRS